MKEKYLFIFSLLLSIPTICLSQSQSDRYISDKYKKIYYTSIEDAERKLIQYQDERISQEISDDDNFSKSCVDNLEALTGIDFFAEQVDDFEKQVKATYNLRNWGL